MTPAGPAGGDSAAAAASDGASVLDNPVWASLRGGHGGVAEVTGRAARYRPELSPFTALADGRDAGAWADLAALIGPAGQALLAGDAPTPPPGWTVLIQVDGVQMVAEPWAGEDPADLAGDAPLDGATVEVLGEADVPEVLDLVGRTQPGPFTARTIELGTYLGIRYGGTLVAMAGERLRPPGWTEVSAVCTDPAYRGRGLAGRLVREISAGIRARGETPFLHAAAANTSAIRLYQKLGFTVRRQVTFASLRPPEARPAESRPAEARPPEAPAPAGD